MFNSINYYWRLCATGFSFALFGIGGVLIPLLASPWIKLTSRSPIVRQRRARLLIHRTFRLYIHTLRFLGVLSWQISGETLLQRPGLLVLANHPCLIDVVFLIAFIPNPDCIVKGRLLTNPAMRGYLRLTGFLTNDSGAELVEAAGKSLAAGSALIIFPEGTRSQPGAGLKFQRGAANVALRTGTAVTPVTILCEPLTLTKKHRWYHIPPRKLHMTLRVGQDIAVSTYDRQTPALAARQLTQDLQDYFTEEIRANDKPICN
ncbi:1-acyl-sn-glycerol-3-phosphate acyltransferase [Cellvibrio sp. KY-GH-1]|uniref:lysophospholipid acyltransferase family protein n=1 Tax=Cellvibrio sp. KY-GH-1 TaxID=2303332 RepID=UPI0012475FCB|nr:lysophospholipid acyltransferase family protein [Cellvibrio sp. KY-GH-1]QEY17420.1 1-acyl-sn-glycerol-3-phosphate acyltransferase [Cellvibrio sp. KY-GH-1]